MATLLAATALRLVTPRRLSRRKRRRRGAWLLFGFGVLVLAIDLVVLAITRWI
jgi:hypothetical protein